MLFSKIFSDLRTTYRKIITAELKKEANQSYSYIKEIINDEVIQRSSNIMPRPFNEVALYPRAGNAYSKLNRWNNRRECEDKETKTAYSGRPLYFPGDLHDICGVLWNYSFYSRV
jgi:hypothetical protein